MEMSSECAEHYFKGHSWIATFVIDRHQIMWWKIRWRHA